MSNYYELLEAEKTCHTIEVRLKATGEEGVAGSQGPDRVAVFYGADDGSDDKVITAEEFNRDWEITACISD